MLKLTFVNKRKALYYQLVDEFHRGHIIPYLARNIGHWRERSNTLSILDYTLVVPLQGERRKKELQFAFTTQINSLGYGKEVCHLIRNIFFTYSINNFLYIQVFIDY